MIVAMCSFKTITERLSVSFKRRANYTVRKSPDTMRDVPSFPGELRYVVSRDTTTQAQTTRRELYVTIQWRRRRRFNCPSVGGFKTSASIESRHRGGTTSRWY